MDDVQSVPLEQRVVEHFDQAASSYVRAYAERTPVAAFFNRRREIIGAMLDRCQGGRLLDVGCGPGMMVETCLDKGFDYIGADISPGMIAECRRRYEGCGDVSFWVAKMQSLPFADASFDVVLCMGALEYLEPAEELQAIGEMVRVLRAGGMLVVSYLNAASLYWVFDRWYDAVRGAMAEPPRWLVKSPRMRAAPPTKVPVRKFHGRICRENLVQAGLAVEETVFYDMSLLPSPLDRRLPRLVNWTGGRFQRLANGPLRHQAKGFIIAARK